MATYQPQYLRHHTHQYYNQPLSTQVVKATTAATIGGSLMLLSGLTLVATVIGLVIATPVMVIFSPVLVPAAITLLLLLGGFLTAGGLGATAAFVLFWMYKYTAGKHPIGADQLDYARHKLANAAYEVKEKAQHLGHESLNTIQGS
ncbi:Oleosin [Heracleum sosnowskyi]|uniref:Oleosin n=1 Tax=Heracleum sosnowskyi TaxID=360622 RepID=A0AAD8HX27_9APIA|nr:Oleosin [Heracleum sosnowskyi]